MTRLPTTVGLFFCCAMGVSVAALGQSTPPKTAPMFEVASIRPSPRPAPNSFGFPVRSSFRIDPGGRITASQITLRELIWRAHGVQPFRLTGGPEWLDTDRFEVAAKPSGGFTGRADDVRAMLRTLLVDRFKLRVSTVTTEQPIYALVRARNDGRLGAGLHPSTANCDVVRARRKPGEPPPQDGSEPDCELAVEMHGGDMTMRFVGETMDGIARLLVGPETRRLVINKTGIAGTFDGVLSFAPSPLPGLPSPPATANGVSMFTALQEQFGLKLLSDRGAGDVLTVGSVQKLDGAE